eukprot:CAMPEP_0117444570 /NCGR_PEP_ID=MMETSP0759-20121206/5311_1 /TAXON_ID=63605 /ORGANISM="Percolomonas cosmopolitus, Strain WS" /LENGTH=1173 /DNA_ID=CAMNT_0005236645 /DNA_START=74 /DNA_END=3595 /DNA_ORIENTATION=+
MATYQYPVSILPSNAFSLLSQELHYTLSINYYSPTKYSFSLKPVKSATSYLLTQNLTLTYQEKDIWHVDSTASKDESTLFKDLSDNLLSFAGTSSAPDASMLLIIYLSEKTDGLILKFQSKLDKEAALKWLCLPPLDQEKMQLFKDRVDVRDRLFGLRSFKSCFVASDSIRFIISIWKCSRMNAVWVGRRMQQEYKLFYHVTNEHLFKDRFLFFRFTEDGSTVQKLDSNGLLGALYGGVFGLIDSTTRTVARHTGTDDVLDFANQLQDDARNYAIDYTTKGFESVKILDTLLDANPKQEMMAAKKMELMEPSLAQILSQKWNTEVTKTAMQKKAMEDVQQMFLYPESLKQLPLLVKTYTEMSNALQNQSLSAMKIQVKQAESSRNLISTAQLYMKQNHTHFDVIQDFVKNERIPSFKLIQSVQTTLNNLRMTREWLQRIQDVRSEYLKLQIVIQDEFGALDLEYTENVNEEELEEIMEEDESTMDLLEVHLRIRSLSEFKLKALHELQSETEMFKAYFSMIDTLNQQFQKIITKHSQNVIYYAAEGEQEKVIQILRIIEREEQYENELREHVSDLQLLQDYQWKNYRQLFYDSIRDSVRTTIRQETTKKPLPDRLNYLADSIEELLYVKQYTRGLFPRHYNIMQFYVQTYESEIRRFIEKRTSNLKKLSNADNSAIVTFLQEYQDYFDDNVLKYVDKLEDYTQLIEKLNAQFVNNCSSKLLDFSDNILKIVFSEDMRPIEIEGSKFSTGPIDLNKTIQAQLDQARQRALIAAPLIQQALQVFHYYTSKFQGQVTKMLDTISVYELCLYINDFDILNQFRVDIGMMCGEILVDIATSDPSRAKVLDSQREKIVEDWVAGEAKLQASRQKFMTELVRIIGEELSKIPKAITSLDHSVLRAVLRDLGEFASDMQDVFSQSRFLHSLQKIDAQVAELFIEGVIVREPEITDAMLQFLQMSEDNLKEVFGALENSQSFRMVSLVRQFLTRFDDGFEAAETTQDLLYDFPDIRREVFAALLKNSRHIPQTRKKEMSEYIVPFFDSSRTVSRNTIFKEKYPRSMKPAPPTLSSAQSKNIAVNNVNLLGGSLWDLVLGTNTTASKINSTAQNGVPKSEGGNPVAGAKKEEEKVDDEPDGADIVHLSDLLGDDVKLPNLSSLLQQSNNYMSDSESTSSDDDE